MLSVEQLVQRSTPSPHRGIPDPIPFGEFVSRLGTGGSDGTANMRTLFDEYVAVGGIPEAVDAWSKKRDIASVDEVLSGILDDLMDSITDERGETFSAKCLGILRSIPRQLSGDNRKFMYGSVSPGLRLRDLRGPLDALEGSGATFEVPIFSKGSRAGSILLCSDTGIMRLLAESSPGYQPGSLLDAMTVSAVLLEMRRVHPELACWRSGNRAEAFTVEGGDGDTVAVQIEPRSRAYARSLREYKVAHPDDRAVIVSPDPVGIPGISWVPPWEASTIRRDRR